MTDLPVDVLTSSNANSEMSDTPEAPATSDSQSTPQFCMQADCVLTRRKLIVTEAKVDDALHEKARVVEEALHYKTRANKLNNQLDAKIKELRDNHKDVISNYDEALDDARHQAVLREGGWEAKKIAARESLVKLQEAEADIAYKQALLDRNRVQFERGNSRIAKLSEEQAGYKKQISDLEARLSAGDMKNSDIQNDATAKAERLTKERDLAKTKCQELDCQLKQGWAQLNKMMGIGNRLEGDFSQQAQVISTLRAQLDAEVNAKSQLRADLDLQKGKVTELENRIHNGEKTYYEMRNDRNLRLEELGWLNGWTTYLESDLKEQREANTLAREGDTQTIAALQHKLQNTLEANATLEAEKELLEKPKLAAEQENKNLKQSNADNEKKICLLRKEIDTAANTKSALEDWLFKPHEKCFRLEGKVALLEKVAIVERAKSNNETTIVDSAAINSENVKDTPAKSSSELPIATFTRSDFLKQRLRELSTTNSQQGKTVETLRTSNGYLRSRNQEFQEKTTILEEEIDGLKAELSDAKTRAEKAAKDVNQVAMNFLLHQANVTDPALNKVRTFENVIRQLNRESDKLNAQLPALESQVEHLRYTNSRLKSELAFVHQQAKVPKQPVLTEVNVTCVYSSVPSPSDGNDSTAPVKQTETEEKKKPHHRGQRGGARRKKKNPNQFAIVASGDLDMSNSNVNSDNSNNENEVVEEQTLLAPDPNATLENSNISEGNVGSAVSNIEREEEQLAARSQEENDNVTSDASNTEETLSCARSVYTPIFFLFIFLFLALSGSRTFNPVAPIDYQPGLFLVSPLPPSASQFYDIYSPPILRTPNPTPTCSPPPTSTSLTSERHQSRCAHI
jgi:chromosome segregation ATPase